MPHGWQSLTNIFGGTVLYPICVEYVFGSPELASWRGTAAMTVKHMQAKITKKEMYL